jgi:uroporphyrinogen decarboxylase
MSKRDAVVAALKFETPDYVPWSWGMTQQCADRFRARFPDIDLSRFPESHVLSLGMSPGRWEEVKPGFWRDAYGVVWDRVVDQDIGTPCEWPIRTPADLDRYVWPDPSRGEWYAEIPARIGNARDRFRLFNIGFSLFERAWTMRGMEDLLVDMVERPEFVEALLDRIVEHNLVIIRRALTYDIDGMFFGDDYGMQTGLIMGLPHWRRFIKPRLARMFAAARQAGKYVGMHSCGCVAVLFDDLVEIGLNIFNPFQPEVMDVFDLIERYRGRLTFWGGMSVQNVLPFGTAAEVRSAAARLIRAGRNGGLIFAPSHSVPRDVPPENLVAMMEELRSQTGYRG